MRILILTNEYPPNIYGGAGVHVDHLCRELQRLPAKPHELQVLCFSPADRRDRQPGVTRIEGPGKALRELRHPKLLDTLYRNMIMTGLAEGVDLIHCHTWYSYLAGLLLKQMLDVPLLITTHSLEPHRPWKEEQLGRAYQATCWLERTALRQADGIIAVSSAMRADIADLYGISSGDIRVIYNGIDTDRFRPVDRPDILEAYGIDVSRPYVLFVGRVTRQKGILHLVDALPHLTSGVQVVLCAGAPDTPEIAEEMQHRVNRARQNAAIDIVWIDDMIPEERLPALYSHAAVFVCPSIYEPFGIINLEAMACGTPVVAAAVGGIPEVVLDEETGSLVPFEPEGPNAPSPRHPRQYTRDLAQAVNALLADPEKRSAMGRRGRQRVEDHFSWRRIAEQTSEYYLSLA